jgi:hypothetical protein
MPQSANPLAPAIGVVFGVLSSCMPVYAAGGFSRNAADNVSSTLLQIISSENIVVLSCPLNRFNNEQRAEITLDLENSIVVSTKFYGVEVSRRNLPFEETDDFISWDIVPATQNHDQDWIVNTVVNFFGTHYELNRTTLQLNGAVDSCQLFRKQL